jgi:integrase
MEGWKAMKKAKITSGVRATREGKLEARVSWTEGGVRKKVTKVVQGQDEGSLFVAQRTSALLEGREVETQKVQQETVGAVLERTYLLHWKGTRDEDRSLVRAEVVADILGRRRSMASVTTADVDQVRLALKARGLAPATINRHLNAIGKMITVATEAGILSTLVRVAREREPEGRVRFLSLSEEQALLQALPTDIRRFCVLLVETGARVGELLKLKPTDVHGDVMHLRKTKTGRPRVVPLSFRALEALEAGQYDESMTQERLTKAWRRAKKATGIDDNEVVPHCLRHTYATRLVAAGVGIEHVQKMLGHASVVTTMRYAHWAPENIERVRRVLNEGCSQEQQRKAV